MLVKDIYGERDNYHDLGLPADLIASTFGKAIHQNRERGNEDEQFTNADKARLDNALIKLYLMLQFSLYSPLQELALHDKQRHWSDI